jgi:hypothetical protein
MQYQQQPISIFQQATIQGHCKPTIIYVVDNHLKRIQLLWKKIKTFLKVLLYEIKTKSFQAMTKNLDEFLEFSNLNGLF